MNTPTIPAETLSAAQFSPRGLDPAQVARSRAENGSNLLSRRPRKSFLRQVLGNFSDPVIRVLLIALAVNLEKAVERHGLAAGGQHLMAEPLVLPLNK